MTRTKFTRTLNTDVSSASDHPVSRGNSTAGERLLGDILKQRRLSEGLTLQKLAQMVGTSKGHIHDLESGRASNPSFDLTMRLFGILNLNADEVWRQLA